MKPTPDQTLRRCRFAPYKDGMGPKFYLTLWDTYTRLSDGKDRLGYRLIMREPSKPLVTLFEGEDFGASPYHAIDSDETVNTLMTFLTLRPGDTDAEYFADYTPEQLDYCAKYAETLSCEVAHRFDPESEL